VRTKKRRKGHQGAKRKEVFSPMSPREQGYNADSPAEVSGRKGDKDEKGPRIR